jgi:DNA polymerase I
LPILKKTPKGQASTSEDVLQELAVEFELPKIILEYRTLSKLQSTYIDKLPKSINAKTGRIHTSYHQTVTATGRLSSSDPNLQNIPIRTKEGRSIREAFIARPGYKILSADYSQIELRILAHLSNDPGLIRGFADNLDIHAITASEVFHVPIENVTEDLRRKAKAINFGLIYGMSDFGLAKQLKISRKEANLYMTIYFSKFNKVLEFMENTRKIAAKNGFVETMFGRRLYLPDINSKNMMLRKAAERAAINAPMQGAQADLIKMAMINLDQWIEQNAKDIFMLMQVHDELIFEVPNDKLNFAKENIANIMNKVANLSVNLKVEIGIGDNWAAAH